MRRRGGGFPGPRWPLRGGVRPAPSFRPSGEVGATGQNRRFSLLLMVRRAVLTKNMGFVLALGKSSWNQERCVVWGVCTGPCLAAPAAIFLFFSLVDVAMARISALGSESEVTL